MHKIHVFITSFNSPHLIEPCIRSIIESKTSLSTVSCVLNSGDYLSSAVLAKAKVPFICLPYNGGQQSLDLNLVFLDKKTDYILIMNDDMIMCSSWEEELLNVAETGNTNCTVALNLVEPEWYSHPLAVKHKIVEDIEKDFGLIQEPFWKAYNEGRYIFRNRISWSHPLLIKQSDYISEEIGGYSNNMDLRFWPGNFSDDAFGRRLFVKYKGNFHFKNTKKACVYHGQSQTLKKIRGHVPDDMFEKVYGINLDEFKREARQYEEY